MIYYTVCWDISLIKKDSSKAVTLVPLYLQRDNLEQKLEETRKELTADKTESSEKITSLEKQVSKYLFNITDCTFN